MQIRTLYDSICVFMPYKRFCKTFATYVKLKCVKISQVKYMGGFLNREKVFSYHHGKYRTRFSSMW